MARTRSIPTDPVPADASNIVVLRPGFAFPAVTEPAARTPKKRGKTRLGRPPTHLQRGTTNAPNLQRDTTTTNGKKSSSSKDLQHTTSLIHYKENDVVSCPATNNALIPKREFMRLVHDLPAMKLRERFRSEEIAHRAMLQRRSKGAIIHPEFVEFRSFLIHVGQRPNDLWSLDRIDVANPTYGPGSVEWSDPRQQANNRHRTTFLKVRGETRPLTDWARMTGQNADTLRARLARGWLHEEVVYGRGKGPTEPVQAGETPSLVVADPWPKGATPALWEPGFLAWKRQFSGPAVPGLTRAVFLAWVGGNKLRIAYEILTARYPGFNDPEASEPPAVRLDPLYATIQAYNPVVRAALGIVWADPQQNSLCGSLREQFPRITNSNDAAKLIRKDEW